MEISITDPVSILFTPDHLALVLDALSEKPYRIAQPVFDSIVSQLKDKAAHEYSPVPQYDATTGSESSALHRHYNDSVSSLGPDRLRSNGSGN